jgi:hypothetical protein
MEGNYLSENGHDSYSRDYGTLIRDDQDNWQFEYFQKLDHWFSLVTSIMKRKRVFINIEYYGNFKMNKKLK